MARRRRHCVRYKRVRGVRRCAKYASGARKKSGYRRVGKSRRRKPAGMARRGSKCTRFKRVRVRGGGMQRRCASYSSAGKRRRRYRRKGR